MDVPFNVDVMDVDQVIRTEGIQKVTSMMIHEPSSKMFHQEGLFSERIFGPLTDTLRYTQFGYIELNTTIIAPMIYREIERLGAFYVNVMAGQVYARFDPDAGSLTKITEAETDDTPNTGTGYNFFLTHYPNIVFPTTDSQARKDRLQLLSKHRQRGLYQRILVLPAGLRDIEEDEGYLSQDDINKLYTTTLALSYAIPPHTTSPMYDGVRFLLQQKINEIYETLRLIVGGTKNSFLQSRFGQRRIALGTRNVISGASFHGQTPDDPQLQRPTETKMGLFQTMKGMTPLVVHKVLEFFREILGQDGAESVPLIDPTTKQLVYTTLSPVDVDLYTTKDGIETWINRFRNKAVRHLPITLASIEGQSFYPILKYQERGVIQFFRSIEDFQTHVEDGDPEQLQPITWFELFYWMTYLVSSDKHVLITRYPVIEEGSTYPSKIHLMSTDPAQVVTYRSPSGLEIQFPQWPILGRDSVDTVLIYPGHIEGLNADYDGDTVSATILLTEEANQECDAYLNSVKGAITPDQKLTYARPTDTIAYVLANLTHDVEVS